ncbi:hypothetical protein METBIDRAFT_11464 [Metschnikowia bicuspidata var. bicuspidata NRRL YB-4993]|uniref:RSE1/DDB1/CPSF1 first beta-propeller domain-containing protein n=1 Tax=Metschnikowia bicuspidata var. bicuspidata NRRL YB-4993 TaxID=869754 RepID=A0A1A0HA22_9ASCO|nr:hypothetical protein METBIDRAFT_11464 [Metschnikowia bicuspidata var. bicuspidata NRRL YB-4993]OBA20850.1 hypothetical protein METBIDRAFT_11464 [Metschnikowia bicuspidata var. bicuspidata NRRL YB-4993]
MLYLLSSLYKQAQSAHAVRIQVDGSPCEFLLVDANGPRLTAWHLDLAPRAQQYLSACHNMDRQSDILALAPLKLKNKNSRIAVLLKSQLEILDVLREAFVPRTVVPFLEVSGHQDSLEIDPLLLSCSEGTHSFLLLYRYTGFVTIFNLEALLSNKSTLRKRNRKHLPGSKTFSIGNVVVSLMAISRKQGAPLIAVLYRDIDFNFSLRYYTFLAELKTLSMVRQMEQFSGAPSHVMGVGGGFLVASDTKLWFFPPHSKTVTLANLVGDPNFPVSCNTLHNVVTLDMSVNADSYLGSRIECSTQIDDNRYLLGSDSGTTLLIYIEMSTSHSVTTVEQFQVLDLGKSTISTNLVHLEDNVVYAGSRNSRSILFRILSLAPHIDILSCMTNASPILDATLCTNKHRKSLLLARGGFHSGELEMVLDSPFKIERQHATHVDHELATFTVTDNDGAKVINIKDATGSVCECLDYPSLHSRSLSLCLIGDTTQEPQLGQGYLESYRKNSSRFWVVDDLRTIEVVEGHSSLVILHSSETLSISMGDVDQVSFLDWHKEGDLLSVIIALCSGTLVQVLFTAKEAKLIGMVPTGLKGKISLCYAFGDSHSLIVMLDGEGLIFQVPVLEVKDTTPAWDLTSTQYLMARQSSGVFNLRRSSTGKILVFDAFSLFFLHPVQDGSFRFELKKLHTFNYRLRTCEITELGGTAGLLLILFEDGTLSKYLFEERQGAIESYSSSSLILLSVNVSDHYTVSLQLDTTPNMSTGQMDTLPSLLLLDLRSLKLLHVYKPRESMNFVDMCLMGKEYTIENKAYIVVANSVENPLEMLKLFRVVLGKIEPVSNISLLGKIPKSFSFSKIACHKNKICIVGDVSLEFTLEATKNPQKEVWRGEVLKHDNAPFFVADVDGNDSFWALADAVRGVFVAPVCESRLYPLSNPFETSFATAVAVLKSRPVLVYGDSEGNIWAAEQVGKWPGSTARVGICCDLSFTQLFWTNVREQINDITVVLENPVAILFATVKGNVYRVQDLKGTPAVQEYLAEEVESRGETAGELTIDEREFIENSSNVFDGRALELFNMADRTCSEALRCEVAKLRCESVLL